ncbi:MAG: serine hydrolase domain-containing protein [Acetobacteraceae bacterium]
MTDDMDRPLRAAVADGRVPGVVAMAADRTGIIYQGAFGRRGLGTEAPMTLDTVFRIASMTKAVTGVAAMQCVERGLLSLDQPAGEIMPELAEPQVLDGFDGNGEPILRPARRQVTLRNLLTHTAGFVYHTWNAAIDSYIVKTGHPTIMSGRLAALGAPLAFDPGERWEYGINIDWAGRMVETVSGMDLEQFMRRNIFAPLGMNDTAFVWEAEHLTRRAQAHSRAADGSLQPIPLTPPTPAEFFAGGGALFSTAPDYMAFLRMLLGGGALDDVRVLRPETVALMTENHIGDLLVGKLPTAHPELSYDAEFFPGMAKKWGLTWLINTEDVPGRRSAGSLAWAGLFNTYYWLDPKQQVTGLLMTQILPFADPIVLRLLDDFETEVYRTTTEKLPHA